MTETHKITVTPPNRQFNNVLGILGLVKNALNELNDPDSWTQRMRETISPKHYLTEAKVIRISLPRRSGISTAALALYDQYPNSLLVYGRYMDRDYQLSEDRWRRFANDKDIFVLPEGLLDVRWDRLHRYLREREPIDVMVFDGVSRMNEECVDEALMMFNPNVKLFVLLG